MFICSVQHTSSEVTERLKQGTGYNIYIKKNKIDTCKETVFMK